MLSLTPRTLRRRLAMIDMNVRRPTIFPTTVFFSRNGKNVGITRNRRQLGTMLITLVGRLLVRTRTFFIKLHIVTIKRSTNPNGKRTMTTRTRLNGRLSILLRIIMRIGNFIKKMRILNVTIRRLRLTRHRKRTIKTGERRIRTKRTTPALIMDTLTLINNDNATPRGIFQRFTRESCLLVRLGSSASVVPYSRLLSAKGMQL